MAEVSDMSELEAENSRLRAETERLKAELAQAREKARDTEESGRAMLFMLEDVEESRMEVVKSREDWEATFDSIADPIFIHDKEMRLMRVNRAYLTASGEAKFGHIIGKPYYEVFPKAAGPLPSCQRSMVKKVEEAEEAEEAEELKVGDIIYLSRAFPIHDVQGVYLYSVHTLEDITERKRAEEKLRETRDYLENLFNHANAPIIVWDASYRITMFNHAFEHLSGLDASEVIGKQIDTLFPADRKDEALSHIHQTKTGERWETIEIPILHKSGEVRTALWNSATLYSADGKNVVATMAQGQDITERKRAEAKINEQLNELNRWYEATLGRETRTLELKREVNELLTQAGQPPRYLSVVSDEPGKSQLTG